MLSPALRRITVLATLAGSLVAGSAAFSASADPLPPVAQGGLPHAIFLVKDLGGGAYWNVTTSSLYAVQAGSDAVVSAAGVSSGLLVATAQVGTDTLLLINGQVLVPLTQALS